METRVRSGEAKEDSVTGAIERQTAKLPSVSFLGLALGAMAASAILKMSGRDNLSLFVGQWAPAFLIMGLYNKTVKQHGSDAISKPRSWQSLTSAEDPRPTAM